MKNQEILNQIYNSMMEVEEQVEEKIFVKVFKKIISKFFLILGVTTATISFLMLIFEAIILFVDISEGVNIINIIDKSIPVAVVFIVSIIVHGICLEMYKNIRV